MQKIENAFLIDVCLGIPLGQIWSPVNIPSVTEVEIPPTYLLRGEQLAAFKKLYISNDSFALRAVEGMTIKANKFLSYSNPSVVQKFDVVSGAKQNDYCSLAKYWWPNKKSNNGKPYVLRDGEVNPECYSDKYDLVRLERFADATLLLSITAFLTGHEVYAEKAADMVRTWIINSDTCQTPHFKFAQLVPGKENQRYQGIIEARRLIYVCEAVQLLKAQEAIEEKELEQCKAWFEELLKWLQNSEQGQAAWGAENNIGFWFDLQRLVFARFIGQERLAESIIRDSVPTRIIEQADEEGRLINELNRARPYDYVAFTLMALAELEAASKRKEIGLADFSLAEGKSYQNAFNWFNETIHSNELHEPAIFLGRLISMHRQLSLLKKENQSLKEALKEKENKAKPNLQNSNGNCNFTGKKVESFEKFNDVISKADCDAFLKRLEFAETEADLLRMELRDLSRDVLMIALRFRGTEKILAEKKNRGLPYGKEQENELLRQQLEEYKVKYNKIVNSRFWRYSLPLRKMINYVRGKNRSK